MAHSKNVNQTNTSMACFMQDNQEVPSEELT